MTTGRINQVLHTSKPLQFSTGSQVSSVDATSHKHSFHAPRQWWKDHLNTNTPFPSPSCYPCISMRNASFQTLSYPSFSYHQAYPANLSQVPAFAQPRWCLPSFPHTLRDERVEETSQRSPLRALALPPGLRRRGRPPKTEQNAT